MGVKDEEKEALSLETESVHRVYDIIASHFSDTRFKVLNVSHTLLMTAMAVSGELFEWTSSWFCGL